ncbi:MAG TPA: hypothetical protein VN659_09715, partial [Pyrinomonadaceae bacterium]|nr:hypothetical protein [Pyrinomonadaceae bacterium]
TLVAIGAGWSPGEAVYRAWAAASLRHLEHGSFSDRRDAKQWSTSRARRFLLDTLADRARGEIEIRLNTLLTGFIGACVVAGGEILGRGVGIDELHAGDHALADAVSRLSVPATGELVITAYPAPPLTSWHEVLKRINDRATEHYSVLEIRNLLPFLHGRAWIVGLTHATPAAEGAAE